MLAKDGRQLPPFRQIAISAIVPDAKTASEDELLERLLAWAPAAVSLGADALMLRQGHWSMTLAQRAAELMAPVTEKLGVPLLLNHPRWMRRLQQQAEPWPPYLAGIHLREEDPHWPADVPCPGWLGRSCHDVQGLLRAQEQGCHYAFLSPIFPTGTHEDAQPLGLQVLQEMVVQVQIPVFALGGVKNQAMAAQCREAGAYGVAAIGWFWPGAM